MAHSLSETCTPLKHAYDTCFNAWFEGYLEPAVSLSAAATPLERSAYSKQKADEFNQKCGKVWEEYRECVQKAVKEKGLDVMLDEARNENPLTKPPEGSKPTTGK